jgi:hypothetical protein
MIQRLKVKKSENNENYTFLVVRLFLLSHDQRQTILLGHNSIGPEKSSSKKSFETLPLGVLGLCC